MFLVIFMSLLCIPLYFLGNAILEYDHERNQREEKQKDRFYSVMRWMLYIPLGYTAVYLFSIPIFFPFIILSGSNSFLYSLLQGSVQAVLSGVCLYILIPSLDKKRKISISAATCFFTSIFSFIFSEELLTTNFIICNLFLLLGGLFFTIRPSALFFKTAVKICYGLSLLFLLFRTLGFITIGGGLNFWALSIPPITIYRSIKGISIYFGVSFATAILISIGYSFLFSFLSMLFVNNKKTDGMT